MEKKCSICGKQYRLHGFTIGNIVKSVTVPDCDCEFEAEENKKAEQDKVRKNEILERKFQNSLMTPYFRNFTFDNPNLDSTNQKKICEKYVEEFNPKTSGGICLLGNVGTGKTVLLACTCNALIKKGYNCLFTTMSALLDKFIESCSFDSEISTGNLYRWIREFDFVVLDDLGREKYTEKRLEIAFRIIDELINYEKIIAFSANYETITKLYSIKEFDAIRDRLAMICKLQLDFEGKSYRRNK